LDFEEYKMKVLFTTPELVPALLFHFSGFSVSSGNRLTRFSNRKFEENTESVLAKLISRYEAMILEEQRKLATAGIKGDLEFCSDSLNKRMRCAQRSWGICHRYF
jgi:hypothetical protein